MLSPPYAAPIVQLPAAEGMNDTLHDATPLAAAVSVHVPGPTNAPALAGVENVTTPPGVPKPSDVKSLTEAVHVTGLPTADGDEPQAAIVEVGSSGPNTYADPCFVFEPTTQMRRSSPFPVPAPDSVGNWSNARVFPAASSGLQRSLPRGTGTGR